MKKSDEKTTLGTQGAVCGFTHSEVNIAVQKHLEIDLLQFFIDLVAQLSKYLLKRTDARCAAVAHSVLGASGQMIWSFHRVDHIFQAHLGRRICQFVAARFPL